MTPTNFEVMIEIMDRQEPFRIYHVALDNGTVLEVDHSDALLLDEGIAIFTMPGNQKLYFDFSSVSFVATGPSHGSSEPL